MQACRIDILDLFGGKKERRTQEINKLFIYCIFVSNKTFVNRKEYSTLLSKYLLINICHQYLYRYLSTLCSVIKTRNAVGGEGGGAGSEMG
jgi:hypothetical protein